MGFYGVLLGFTEFYRVLLGFNRSYLVLLGFTYFYFVSLMNFDLVLFIPTGSLGLYRVLLGFT